MKQEDVKDMTFGEAWSERAELARGPGKNRKTERFKALDARISQLYRECRCRELQNKRTAQ